MPNESKDLAGPARLISGALAAGFEILSVVLGLLFMGTIGLQVSDSQMSVAWGVWFGCVVASLLGIFVAVRKGNLGWLFAAALVPAASSLLLAQVFLRVSASQ